MKHTPPKGATINLWLLYSTSTDGTYLEDVFTHKVQAETALRWYEEHERGDARYYIRERTTHAHGELFETN